MISQFLTFAYFAPDSMVPIASALASIVGVLLVGWQYFLRGAGWLFYRVKSLLVRSEESK